MHKRNPNEMKKLYNMINSNTKYLNVPHGLPDHMKRATSSQINEFMDRNKIYAKRSENPMVIPTKIIEIPQSLSKRYSEIDNDEIIFEGELMKYKPGIKN